MQYLLLINKAQLQYNGRLVSKKTYETMRELIAKNGDEYSEEHDEKSDTMTLKLSKLFK